MAISPRDRARGFVDGDEIHLAAFRQKAMRKGLSRQQIEGLIDLYGETVQRGQLNEYALPSLKERAERLGADWDVVDDVVGEALGHAIDGTVPDYTPPSASDDEATIASAEELMKNPPTWHANKEAQDNYFDAIARREERMETFEVGEPTTTDSAPDTQTSSNQGDTNE